ncbi:MAG: AI-2E family transporter [Porphyrobacter sp.]|nr:AI-2E family transporter [Porphyrobacter sp.]
MARDTDRSTTSPDAAADRLRNRLLYVIAAAALIWLLRETYTVLMPITTALLLALGVWPLVVSIRDRMPRRLGWLGALAGVLSVVGILAIFFAGIGYAGRRVYSLALEVGPLLRERLDHLPFDMPDIIADGPDPNHQALATGGDIASSALTVLNITATTAGTIILILFLMLLMLTEAGNWNAKVRSLVKGDGDTRWHVIARSVGSKFRAYFTTRLLLGVISGALYVGFLLLFGVEYAVLWGLLTVLLNFIPNVGSIISGTLPTIYVFVTRDIGTALIIGAGLLVIEQTIGNFVDPKLMGRRLAISPLVVLVALVFWTLLWGFVGALLAVPLTVLVTVVMAHFERFKPAALLLTDREDIDALDDYRTPD